jgi:hypothetical protein
MQGVSCCSKANKVSMIPQFLECFIWEFFGIDSGIAEALCAEREREINVL